MKETLCNGQEDYQRAYVAKCQFKGGELPFWYGTVFVRLGATHQEIEAEITKQHRRHYPIDHEDAVIQEIHPGHLVFIRE